MLNRMLGVLLCASAATAVSATAQRPPAAAPDARVVLRPARVWDGDAMHDGWAVRVKGDRIDAVGPAATVEPPMRR